MLVRGVQHLCQSRSPLQHPSIPILGLDTGTGGVGVIRGLTYWNMDLRVTKNIKIYERVSLEFQYVVTNVFNHPVFYRSEPRSDSRSA